MSLGDRLREMLDPGATAGSSGPSGQTGTSTPPSPTRRRQRTQAQPVNPGVRNYDVDPPRPMARGQWIFLGLAAALAVALTAGLVFVILTVIRPGASPATPTPLPVIASPTAASSVAQIFATTAPSPSAAAVTPPPVGQRVQVANTGNDGVNLRREPGQAGERMKTIPEGTLMEVVGPDRTIDGIVWRNVRDPQGESGWIAGNFLAPEGSVAPAAAIPGSNLPPAPSGAAPAASTPVAAAPAAPRPTTAPASQAAASRAQVGNTNGQGANIRSEPGANGRILKTMAEGANLEVLGPEREVDGQVWRQVRDPVSGATGWIVRGVVAPAGSLPTPVPAVTRAPAAPARGTTPAPAAKPSTGATPPAPGSGSTPPAGSGSTPSTPVPAKPTTPPGDLPIIIQPATPRAQSSTQVPVTTPRPTVQGGSEKPSEKPNADP